MKGFISLTFHGILDYLMAGLLISSPWLFNFYLVGGASLIMPIFFGWILLIMTLFTDYKPGLIRVFPIQMHFVMEMFAGFLIAVGPWLYDFSAKVYAPHLIMGVALMFMALYTVKSPFINKPHDSLQEAGITSTDSSEGKLMI